jgi:spore maturation protein SpmA
LKFFPFLGLDIATTWLGRTTMSTVNLVSKKKILSSSSQACFWSLEGLLLGLSCSIVIMCRWGLVFVTIFVHLTTCHCHLT